MLEGRRSSPLLDRIRQRESSFSQGISVLLGLPPEAGAEEPVIAPVSPAGQGEEEEPSRLNRGALLSRLQGTHQANLNRGFYALLNTAVPTAQVVMGADAADASAFRVVLMDLQDIAANPYLPLIATDGESMDLLVQSIREQGILDPLQVHPAPSDVPGEARYWIISGERRRQAALQAGLRQVPVIVKDVSPRAALQMFLSDAIHTYQLSIIDHAQVYRVLTQEMGMTSLQVASRIGASADDVEAELGFLQFEDPIQESLRDGRLKGVQARVLLEAPDEESRRTLWEYALRYRPAPGRMRARLAHLMAGEPEAC